MKHIFFSILIMGSQAMAGVHFDKDTYYVHPLLTKAQCASAHAQGHAVNCNQTAAFLADGRATVLLTDIRNLGTYELKGNQIIVSFGTAHDSGAEMTFTLSANQKIMKDETGNQWNKVQ